MCLSQNEKQSVKKTRCQLQQGNVTRYSDYNIYEFIFVYIFNLPKTRICMEYYVLCFGMWYSKPIIC